MKNILTTLVFLVLSATSLAVPPITTDKTITLNTNPQMLTASEIIGEDFDPDGTELELIIVDDVHGGTTNWSWTNNHWSSVEYTASPADSLKRFTYIVRDGDGETMWGYVTLITSVFPVPTDTPEATPVTTPTPTPMVPEQTPVPPVGCEPLTDRNTYFFAHSLIDFTGNVESTSQTNILYWLNHFTQNLTANGQFGFIDGHMRPFSPRDQLSWEGVQSGWLGDFHSSEYTTVFITPRNFAQNVSPSTPYEGGSAGNPLDDTLELVRQVGVDKEFIIYASWPDMNRYGFPNTDTVGYYAYSMGDFYQWFVDLHAGILEQEPNLNITIQPTGYVLARLFTETSLRDLHVTDLYVDNSPHGTETLYFLAGLITSIYSYDVVPDLLYTPPENVHTLVRQDFGNIVKFILESKE